MTTTQPTGASDAAIAQAFREVTKSSHPGMWVEAIGVSALLMRADEIDRITATPPAQVAGSGMGVEISAAQVLRACNAYDCAAQVDGEAQMECAQYPWMHSALSAARLNDWNNATVHGWRLVDGVRVFSITPPSGLLPPQEFVRYDDHQHILTAQPAPVVGGDYVPTVPDAVAVLANLRAQFEALPIRHEPISGQTFSYVERDNVMALIEQAEMNFSKPWPGIRDLCGDAK